MDSKFKIAWWTEHAAGEFPTEYSSEEEATTAAEEWEKGMMAADSTAEEGDYEWEVVEVENEEEEEDFEEYESPRDMGWVGHDGRP